jgi:hypothetical protein
MRVSGLFLLSGIAFALPTDLDKKDTGKRETKRPAKA